MRAIARKWNELSSFFVFAAKLFFFLFSRFFLRLEGNYALKWMEHPRFPASPFPQGQRSPKVAVHLLTEGERMSGGLDQFPLGTGSRTPGSVVIGDGKYPLYDLSLGKPKGRLDVQVLVTGCHGYRMGSGWVSFAWL